MYLSRIALQNVRGFEGFEMVLPPSTQHHAPWAVILGDNGTGKTTLLRCIAMGLSGASGASSLLSELYGEWLRDIGKEAIITLELQESEEGSRTHRIVTTVEHGASGEYEIKQDNAEDTPLDVFICGYGIGRGVSGTRAYESYSPIDSLISLFNYSAEQQNPELILRRLKDHERIDETELLASVDRVLMLNAGATKLGRNGITVSGPWGSDITLGALGDGYQSTVTMFCDLLHWLFLYDESVFAPGEKLRGIVIIDQLEQHLHPRWQRSILQLLSDQFPHIQFIVTTHSPLCALGTADLQGENYELLLLRQEHGKAIRSFELPSFAGWRADQVLTSDAFGLLTSRSVETEDRLRRLRELDLKEERTEADEIEYKSILDVLESEAPPAAESAMEQQIQERILKLLEEMKTKDCATE